MNAVAAVILEAATVNQQKKASSAVVAAVTLEAASVNLQKKASFAVVAAVAAVAAEVSVEDEDVAQEGSEALALLSAKDSHVTSYCWETGGAAALLGAVVAVVVFAVNCQDAVALAIAETVNP